MFNLLSKHDSSVQNEILSLMEQVQSNAAAEKRSIEKKKAFASSKGNQKRSLENDGGMSL